MFLLNSIDSWGFHRYKIVYTDCATSLGGRTSEPAAGRGDAGPELSSRCRMNREIGLSQQRNPGTTGGEEQRCCKRSRDIGQSSAMLGQDLKLLGRSR